MLFLQYYRLEKKNPQHIVEIHATTKNINMGEQKWENNATDTTERKINRHTINRKQQTLHII